MSEDAELPKALVKKIAKSKLTNLEISRIEKLDAEKKEGKEAKARDIQISKDALLALGESARVFIHYLTATGNDICKESKRQIMSVDDIFTALEDLEFGELLPPLKESLEGFKVENKEKSKKRAEQQKKRKLEDAEKQAEAARQSQLNEANAANQASQNQALTPTEKKDEKKDGEVKESKEGGQDVPMNNASPNIEPSSKIARLEEVPASVEPQDTKMTDVSATQ